LIHLLLYLHTQNCVNWVVSAAKKGEFLRDVNHGCTDISSGKKKKKKKKKIVFIFLIIHLFCNLIGLDIADFTLNEMLDYIMKFIFVKMGDIEPEENDEEEEDLDNRELTKEELAEVEGIDVLSVE
jgi:uncharacterized membrane protein YiaA